MGSSPVTSTKNRRSAFAGLRFFAAATEFGCADSWSKAKRALAGRAPAQMRKQMRGKRRNKPPGQAARNAAADATALFRRRDQEVVGPAVTSTKNRRSAFAGLRFLVAATEFERADSWSKAKRALAERVPAQMRKQMRGKRVSRRFFCQSPGGALTACELGNGTWNVPFLDRARTLPRETSKPPGQAARNAAAGFAALFRRRDQEVVDPSVTSIIFIARKSDSYSVVLENLCKNIRKHSQLRMQISDKGGIMNGRWRSERRRDDRKNIWTKKLKAYCLITKIIRRRING